MLKFSHISMMVAATMLIMLMASFFSQPTCGAALVADIQGVPYHVKRSFCNTYGGCSSASTKRSMQQQQQAAADATYSTVEPLDSRELASSNAITKKDSSAGLVAEILGDLIEYLQSDEKYRQGKYVVMVPKQVDGSRSLLSSNGNQRENENPGEMQELQISRLYVKRDD